ncbi:MAG: exonuclease subunit SbcD [Akkermansia sp.]|nr:exonuclease subunit SbcD [Akkermansia sp.]
MKILHTSDWHLGNRMLDKSRTEEFRDFTTWLLQLMREKQVDALLISGDIFDNSTPGDSTLELYHDFISKADETGCRYIIITGGNHDGIALLDSSGPLLKRHNTYMVSSLKKEESNKCLIPLQHRDGTPAALVCAVPYLRPREVSLSVSPDADINDGYIRGIRSVYDEVATHAQEWKAANSGLPVICMGHLAVSGAEATASTHRTIGLLDEVSKSIFSETFDYVALGHIHKGYALDRGRICYSGSPLPMGIDETENRHMLLVDVQQDGIRTEEIPVPLFTLPVRHECSNVDELNALPGIVAKEAADCNRVCLQLIYSGDDLTTDQLKAKADELFKTLYHYKITFRRPGMYMSVEEEEVDDGLKNKSPEDIFNICLEKHNLSPEMAAGVTACFRKVLSDLNI